MLFSKQHCYTSHAAKITLFPLYSNLKLYKRLCSNNYIWVFCTFNNILLYFLSFLLSLLSQIFAIFVVSN